MRMTVLGMGECHQRANDSLHSIAIMETDSPSAGHGKTPMYKLENLLKFTPHEQFLNAYVRLDCFNCVLPPCYRNSPTQRNPSRRGFLRFLSFSCG